jgi:hypothetical protein
VYDGFFVALEGHHADIHRQYLDVVRVQSGAVDRLQRVFVDRLGAGLPALPSGGRAQTTNARLPNRRSSPTGSPCRPA